MENSKQSVRVSKRKALLVKLAERFVPQMLLLMIAFVGLRICVRLYYGTPLNWLQFNGIPYTSILPLLILGLVAWHFRKEMI